MATTKRYISLTGTSYTFPVTVGGSQKFISLSGAQLDYITSNSEIQEQIEANKKFKRGDIGLAEGNKAAEVAPIPVSFEPAVFNDPTTPQEAAAVLRAKPYLIIHTALKTPQAIAAKAALVGASFPNVSF